MHHLSLKKMKRLMNQLSVRTVVQKKNNRVLINNIIIINITRTRRDNSDYYAKGWLDCPPYGQDIGCLVPSKFLLVSLLMTVSSLVKDTPLDKSFTNKELGRKVGLASAMLALCRFMIIDEIFCEANLQLLFIAVESAPSETVRSNCTIVLGDLAVRFPNLLEPWTVNMYSRLHDPSVSVRTYAVLVLSHLILNDMMKVKWHITLYENERISNLTKLFSNELSKKGNNPIYNLLPDILRKLSNQVLKRESYFNIMQFLIGSISKMKGNGKTYHIVSHICLLLIRGLKADRFI